MKIEVLITNGNVRPGLAIARSLARQGISFIIVGDRPGSLAFRSRHVTHTAVGPDPGNEPDAYFEFILALVKRHGIELVIPVLEDSLLPLLEHRSELEAHTRLAAAQTDALRNVLDKRMNLALVRELGVDCPGEYALESTDQIPDMIETLGFPIVLKPQGSPHDKQLPAFPFKVLFANNEQQLRDYLDQYCSDGVYPMFQECVFGTPHSLCCFAVNGEIVAMHEYRSLRTTKGQGVFRQFVPNTPAGEVGARRMLKALKWDGLAHFDFYIEHGTNRLRYMETNGRFWSSVAGSIHAGWDFPLWVYRYFRHGEAPVPGPYEIGTQMCWRRGDLAALFHYYTGGPPPTKDPSVGKLKATLQYLAAFRPSVKSDLFRWDDPLPEFADHWSLVRRGLEAAFEKGFAKDPTRVSTPGQ